MRLWIFEKGTDQPDDDLRLKVLFRRRWREVERMVDGTINRAMAAGLEKSISVPSRMLPETWGVRVREGGHHGFALLDMIFKSWGRFY